MKLMTQANVTLINHLVDEAKKERHNSAGQSTNSKANEANNSEDPRLQAIQQRTRNSEMVLRDDVLDKLEAAITHSMSRVTGVVNKLDRRLGRVHRDFEYAVPVIARAKESYDELALALRQNSNDVSCAVLE